MVYIVKNSLGEQVNLIEISPEQVESYAALTGYTLEPLPERTPEPIKEATE